MSELDYAVETVLRRERDAYREALERVTKERDEARGAYKDAKALVVMLDDAIKRGAGCCGDAIGRGTRVTQIRRLFDDIDTGAWAESHGERLNVAWKDRDAALAACGEMRAALEAFVAWGCGDHAPNDCPDGCPGLAAEELAVRALASNAGRGWVSPEEHAKVVADWVSPEAFDAALREVATHSFASGRWYEMADEFDAMVSVADFDHEPIIAAAKAKHGGGK